MDKMKLERAYRSLTKTGMEFFRALSPSAQKVMHEALKKGDARYSYYVESLVKKEMGNNAEASFLADNIFNVVRSVRQYRASRARRDDKTPLQKHYFKSRDHLMSAITIRRPRSAPTISQGIKTEVLEVKGSGRHNWDPVIKVSPAWYAMTQKLGAVTVSKDRVVLSAVYSFRIDDNSSVYKGDVLDVKERCVKSGWIARWHNGKNTELRFGDTSSAAITRLQTAIMNNVMEEMKIG